jgi:acetyltransferase-like isoleucine patch superfamily enzyme
VRGANSLWQWTSTVNPLRAIKNFLIIYICRVTPSLRWKRYLYQRLGVKVGENTAIGLMSMIDIFFPQYITIGQNCIIGYNSTILCHEYIIEEWRRGPVIIGDNVVIGANVVILAGVVIGDGATISACSLVNSDVAPGTLVGGVPAVQLRSREERERGR